MMSTPTPQVQAAGSLTDALSAQHRSRPNGPWVMVQRWHDLLFAHWRCAVSELRALVPAPLDIDTHNGSAWIGVVPFCMTGVRFRGIPPIPTAHSFLELNVRTYVVKDGKPGVWFFSLDAASLLAVMGARVGMYLPYFRATMSVNRRGGLINYRSVRWNDDNPSAVFEGSYRPVGNSTVPPEGSLEFFLTERYCLYSSDGSRIWRGDIYHPRWQLRPAEAQFKLNTMTAAAGVSSCEGPPLLHFSEFQDVRFWWPVRVV